MDQGDLRRIVQSHRSKGGADRSADVQIASLYPVKALAIRGPQVRKSALILHQDTGIVQEKEILL